MKMDVDERHGIHARDDGGRRQAGRFRTDVTGGDVARGLGLSLGARVKGRGFFCFFGFFCFLVFVLVGVDRGGPVGVPGVERLLRVQQPLLLGLAELAVAGE